MKIDENGMCALSEEDYSYHTRATKQKRTNGDSIRAMSDEELAEFISNKARTFGEEYEGYMSALDWLKKGVEDEE